MFMSLATQRLHFAGEGTSLHLLTHGIGGGRKQKKGENMFPKFYWSNVAQFGGCIDAEGTQRTSDVVSVWLGAFPSLTDMCLDAIAGFGNVREVCSTVFYRACYAQYRTPMVMSKTGFFFLAGSSFGDPLGSWIACSV